MYVIATAGHVDHGKSTLIRALTGMEPDRWAEERRRGMTIDLGYAWTTLPELPGGAEDSTVAFVDVPGHHRFITNMLAGIGPVPAVLLVVAADDGWGRQTTEHLAALDALGVRHGLMAITRSDLADPELAEAEARTYLEGTALAGIEAVAVSPVTGQGIDELRAALARMTAALDAPDSSATRLWIDRVFTVPGAGTVVTGTLATGRIAVGDELIATGSGRSVHVRGLQSLNRSVESVSAVARVAVNLRGVKTGEIRRGHALIGAGRWAVSRRVDVRLTNLDGRLPGQAILHLGSAAVLARLRPLGADTARLTLDAELPLHVGDRAILRDPGRQQVISGTVVLDIDPPAFTRRGAAARRGAELAALTGVPDPAGELVRRGAARHDWLVAAGLLDPDSPVPAGAAALGGWLVADEQWRGWQADLHGCVDRWAAEHPMSPGVPRGAIASLLRLPDAALLEPLVRHGGDLVLDASGVHRREVGAVLPADAEAALEVLCKGLAESPFAAAESTELATAGLTEAHLSVAARTGRLLRVAAGIYLLPDAVSVAAQRLAALPQPFTLSQARQALDTTRRVAVPLLELLDRRGVTQRVDAQMRTLR
jgi:selenocysteine-specific elongation factor